MSSRKPKILLIGLYIPAYGFTRVLSHLAKGLKSNFEIHYLGVGYEGSVMEKDGVTIYPGILKDHHQDILGIQALKNLLPIVQPELAVVVHDLHWLENYVNVLNDYQPRPLIATYIPMDGYLKDAEMIRFIENTDHCFVYTKFGKSNLKEAERELQKEKSGFKLPPITIVPHGIDSATFFPTSKTLPHSNQTREKSRALAFPEEDLTDAFIVMNGNQPWPRKKLDVTIEGFAQFSRNKPKHVKLYLHHGFSNPEYANKIMDLIKINGLQNRILIRKGEKTVSESMMNHFYNACDIGINTAMGEGWGLVSFEHAATGAAQIIPDHTACGEIWDKHAYLLRTSEEKPVWFSPLKMKEVTAKEVAHSLEVLYVEKIYRELLAKAALRLTNQPKFNWKTIESQWEQSCSDILINNKGKTATAYPDGRGAKVKNFYLELN